MAPKKKCQTIISYAFFSKRKEGKEGAKNVPKQQKKNLDKTGLTKTEIPPYRDLDEGLRIGGGGVKFGEEKIKRGGLYHFFHKLNWI